MGKIKDWFKRITKKLFRKKSPSSPPRIVIKEWNERRPISTQHTPNAPKITIKEASSRTFPISGSNLSPNEAEVSNSCLGQDIIVRKQRKPSRCPMCATRGCITENYGERLRWFCSVCRHTFKN